MASSFVGFTRATQGNIAIMTGLLFGMVAMAAGGGVDMASAYEYRSDLQAVADRAAIYGARDEEREEADVETFAIEALSKYERNTFDITVDKSGSEVTVRIDGQSENRFMGLFGMRTIDVGVESKAANVPGLVTDIEVALVLDVTESMADDMPALREAALELVNQLYEAGEERVKISVVPYTATVNIGHDASMDWMDTNAQNAHHAIESEQVMVKQCIVPSVPGGNTATGNTTPGCSAICGCAGQAACGGGGDGASLDILDGLRYAGSPILEKIAALITPTGAIAGSHSYPVPAATACPFYTPNEINNFDLFDAIPNTDWMGCVEARPAPYDVTDVAPGSDADSKFVPFFWADDSDRYADTETWLNNYLDDNIGLEAEAPAQVPNWYLTQRASIYKYDGVTPADIVEMGANMKGPNRSCPAPILPLTSSKATVVQKINDLTHRNGGGTVISEGLAWGWRAVSPGEPFSQGVAYDNPEVKKIIILLSDGANAVQQRGEKADGMPVDKDVSGDYTAYGYASSFTNGQRRRAFFDSASNPGTPYFKQIREYLDERTQLVCENIKTADERNPVEIYSVLVGDHDQRTEKLLSDCATAEITHYRNASQMTELKEAFAEVATDIIGAGRARIIQ